MEKGEQNKPWPKYIKLRNKNYFNFKRKFGMQNQSTLLTYYFSRLQIPRFLTVNQPCFLEIAEFL